MYSTCDADGLQQQQQQLRLCCGRLCYVLERCCLLVLAATEAISEENKA